jgi:hypothetical protein
MIEFLGAGESYLGVSLGELARIRGIEEAVRVRERVSRRELLAELRTADVLLLLAREQAEQIPHKLFEYLGVRRPILAIVDEGGSSARLLKRVGGHHIISSTCPDDIADAMEEMCRNESERDRREDVSCSDVDSLFLDELRSDRQMRRITDIVVNRVAIMR